MHVAHDDPAVLGRVVAVRHEAELADLLAGTQPPGEGRALDHVVLEHAVARHRPVEADRPAEAVAAAGEPLVVPRELLGVLVVAVLADLAGHGVDGEADQRREPLVGAGELGGEHLLVTHRVDDDLVTVLVGVERVEDVAGVDLEPAHVAAHALARQQPDARGVVVVPGVGQLARRAAAPGHRTDQRVGQRVAADDAVEREPGRQSQRAGHRACDHVDVEGDRQVVDHHVVLGQGEVVHHRAAVDLDLHLAPQPARGVEDGVVDAVAAGPAVGDRVQLTGRGVLVGVGGVARGEGAGEAAAPDRLELVGQLVGRRAGLDERHRAPAVLHEVGVGREVVAVGADPAVAVPAGRAVGDPQPVGHAGAEEPVVGVGVDGVGSVEAGVGPDPEVAAVEVVRERARHREVEGGDLVAHRGEAVLQVAVHAVSL